MEKAKTVEWFDDRFYWHPELKEYVASVTTIDSYVVNKKNLNTWRGDLGNELADLRSTLAANSGKKIHAILEQYMKGDEITYDKTTMTQDIWLKVWRGVKIIKELKPRKVLAIEKTVFGDKYAGTIDLVLYLEAGTYSLGSRVPLKIEKGVYVCDWKSGKFVGDSTDRQLAAYAKAYESIGIAPNGALVFHLGAKTKSGYSVKKLDGKDIDKAYGAFSKIKDVFYELYPNLSAKELDIPETFKMKGCQS